jgi:hypothetical protein
MNVHSPKGSFKNNRFLLGFLRFDGVVPVAVEVVSDYVEGGHFDIADLDALWVCVGV